MRIALIALAGACVALAGCGAAKKPVRAPCPAGKLCVEIGNSAEPLDLDPQKITMTQEDWIVGDMMIGLTTNAADGSTIPGMAERWETSADGLVWTFHLRDAKWSDGVPVTADDFVYGMRRLMDPKTASEYAYLLYFIKNAQAVNEGKLPLDQLGISAPDQKTVQITLNHPAPYLAELATHQTFYPVPKHAYDKLGDKWSRPENYVSNGPFVIRSWKLGDRIVAVKNPYFYDAKNVCFDQVAYYPTNDAVSAERRVKTGELDINTDVQSNRIGLLRRDHPEIIRTHTWLGVAYLPFNAHEKAFQDRRVREAVAMAIDRDFITQKLMRGGQEPAYGFTPPGVANYTQPKPPEWASWPLAKRQAEARRLLAEAGYGPKNPLKFEIKHRNTADPMLFMPAIQADLREVGIQPTLVQNESQVAYQSYRARDFQVADAAWIADYNDAKSFLDQMQSQTGDMNYADYSNPTYDGLLAKADQEKDPVKRAQLLSQAESVMIADYPVVPVFYYVNKELVSPRITGWVDNIVDKHRTRYLCFKDAKR